MKLVSPRRIVQGFCLALFVFLIAITRYPFKEWLPVDTFLVLDPLLALTASLAAWSPAPGWWIALLVLVLTFILGRFFCGWMCPMGTCLDLAEAATFTKRRRKVPNDRLYYRNLKYYLLAFVIGSSLIGFSLAYWLDPISLITRGFTYILAPAVVFLANFGLDLFRPIAERMEWYDLARTSFEPKLFSTPALLTMLLLAGIVALSSLQKRFWCRAVCPLGGLFAITSRFSLMRRGVNDSCANDGICSRDCETGAIPKKTEQITRPGECILCLKCESNCPHQANTFSLHKLSPQQGTDPTRRRVLGLAAGGLTAGFFLKMSPSTALLDERVIRPPGALPKDKFLETCVRCGQCVKCCPTNTLQPALGEGGLPGLLAPFHRLRLAGCDQDCNLCGQVCPTQAIRDLDLEEKRYAKIGTARILRDRCVVWLNGMGCLVCDEVCPYNAIYWKTENGIRVPYVDEKRCNGCGLCETACPVYGASAIVIGPHGEIRLSTGSYISEAKSLGLKLNLKETDPYKDV